MGPKRRDTEAANELFNFKKSEKSKLTNITGRQGRKIYFKIHVKETQRETLKKLSRTRSDGDR